MCQGECQAVLQPVKNEPVKSYDTVPTTQQFALIGKNYKYMDARKLAKRTEATERKNSVLCGAAC